MFSYMEWHIFGRLNINALAKLLFHNLHKKLVKTRIGIQNSWFFATILKPFTEFCHKIISLSQQY